MKKYSLVLCLLFVTLTSSAQIERKPDVVKTDSAQTAAEYNKVDKQNRKDRYKELDLTREQKIKMKEIMRVSKAAKQTIENNTELSAQEKKKQVRALQKEQAQKVQEILTPEQREKLKASKAGKP